MENLATIQNLMVKVNNDILGIDYLSESDLQTIHKILHDVVLMLEIPNPPEPNDTLIKAQVEYSSNSEKARNR